MKDVQRWEGVTDWIGIPPSKRFELESRNPTTDQYKQACWDYWLYNHPAPSWRILADGLFFWGKHGALEVLQMNYLKGEYVCTFTCTSILSVQVEHVHYQECLDIHSLISLCYIYCYSKFGPSFIVPPGPYYFKIFGFPDLLTPSMHVINYSTDSERVRGWIPSINC